MLNRLNRCLVLGTAIKVTNKPSLQRPTIQQKQHRVHQLSFSSFLSTMPTTWKPLMTAIFSSSSNSEVPCSAYPAFWGGRESLRALLATGRFLGLAWHLVFHIFFLPVLISNVSWCFKRGRRLSMPKSIWWTFWWSKNLKLHSLLN